MRRRNICALSICLPALLLSSLSLQHAAVGNEAASKRSIRVAIFADEGATKAGISRVKEALPQSQNFDVKAIAAEEIRGGRLKRFDVLIHGGGSASAQAKALGKEGRTAVKKFVHDGGGLVGICAGAYLASSQYDWSLHVLDARVIDGAHWARGEGTVQIRLSSAGKSALHSDKETCSIHFENGPLLGPMKEGDADAFEALAIFDTEIATNGAAAGIMKGTTAVARGRYGKGRVICFSPHPEKSPGRETLLQEAVRWAAGFPSGAKK